jgi:hypothetical protein
MRNYRLPNAIIAGVNKAGTTSLFDYLRQHPQIGGSSVKETCYFLPARYGGLVGDVDEYCKLFREVSDMPVRLEATPGYFYGGGALIREVRRVLGARVRIIIVLRDPVQRLLSFFRAQKALLELPGDLALQDYVDRCLSLSEQQVHKKKNNAYFGIEGGKYAKYLPLWNSVFGENLIVLFTENIKRDPIGALKKTLQFLGVDSEGAEKIDLTRQNKSVNFKNRFLQKVALEVNQYGETFWRRHKWLKKRLRQLYFAVNGRKFNRSYNKETIDRLRSIYVPHNKRLKSQLSEVEYSDLPEWVSVFN